MKRHKLGSVLLYTAVAAIWCGCAPEKPQKPTQQVQKTPAPAKIVQFYASPSVVPRGEQTQLCYSVEDAVEVRLSPQVEPIKPAYTHCVVFKPLKSGTYTLFAKGADGKEVSQSAEIKLTAAVAKAPAATTAPTHILFFMSASGMVPAGRQVTLCYGVEGVQTVRLEPDGRSLPALSRSCFTVEPKRTTTYILVAGRDRASVTVRVE
jgi:hypothetical protein